MNRTIASIFCFLVAAVFLAPAGAAQAGKPVAKCESECYPQSVDVNGPDLKRGDAIVRTILYGHFEDILNRAPLNTQLPNKEPGIEPDLNRGFLMPTLTTHVHPDYDFAFNNNYFTMYSSAGLIEIIDGAWRSHQEPGLAEDVEIKSDKVNLYWYLSANPVPNSNSGTFPGSAANADVIPQVAIKARMETGRQPYSTKSVLIAEGDTGKGDQADLIGGSDRVNMITQPGTPDVYEFKVPMDVKTHMIPNVASSAGFVVSVHPYQIRDKTNGNEFMQSDWRVHTGYDYPPRLVFDMGNPLLTKASSLSLFDNNMFIRWSFVSPWGSYDTDDRSLEITLSGASEATNKLVSLVILKRSVDHDGHFKPINATWKFDYQKANLADGDYSFHVSIKNLQNTYILEQELPFHVAKGVPDVKVIGGGRGGDAGSAASVTSESKGLPGFEPLFLLAAVLVVAFAVRRRRA